MQAHGKQGDASDFSCVLTALCPRARTWRKALFEKKKSFLQWITRSQTGKFTLLLPVMEKYIVCHGQVIII